MDISYNDLRNKEIVNLSDGSKMGRIVDVIFNSDSGKVIGLVAPGEKRFLKKADEIFIPLEKVRRIGDDVILIRLELSDGYFNRLGNSKIDKKIVSNRFYSKEMNSGSKGSFIRYRKLDNKKYK